MRNTKRHSCRVSGIVKARLKWGVGVIILFNCTSNAIAQQTTSAPSAAAPQAASASSVQGVTVTARAPGYSSSIDGRSYSLGSDLKTATGTLADVLRDVPSVQVDIEGNISLRGDSNVTILVDGKPSALFSGPGRAQALQSMSADQYARVEVMTNPSAGQTAEGSGGIINLISKHPPKGGAGPTSSGTLKAEVGSGDRYDLGGNGAYTSGGLSLNGSADYRRTAFARAIDNRYAIPDTATGTLSPAEQVQQQQQNDGDLTLNGSLGYDIDAPDHLDVSANLETVHESRAQTATYQTDAVSGPLALDYLAPGYTHTFLTTSSESLGLTRTLPGEGQNLSAKLSVSQGSETAQTAAAYTYTAPVQPSLYQDQTRHLTFPDLDLQVDYKVALSNKAKLSLGYEGKFDWQGATEQGMQGVSAGTAVADPVFVEHFTFHQQVNSVYATYEQVFGKLTVQPGLRVENATLTTDLVSAAESGRQAYLEAYPSLHLDYALNDATDVRASYGRRVERPDAIELDPFRVESSATLYSAGNPNLKPAITQSWELGYEYRKKTDDLQATLFFRDKSNVVTTVQNDIGGNVLLSTYENLGETRNTGIELVFNRDLLKHLTLNTSADFQHSEVNAGNLGIDGVRTAFIKSGRATVDWQLGADDYFQVGAQASGRELTAQGYFGGAVFSDLGWRHRFNSKISTSITAQDPFGLSRRTIETDTATIVDVQKRKFNYSAAFFSLTYALGGAPKRPADNFDFGAHPGGS
ncbi:MAG: TonB-dependent receptor domain-containing protein [Caulobacteraceae bacterium]